MRNTVIPFWFADTKNSKDTTQNHRIEKMMTPPNDPIPTTIDAAEEQNISFSTKPVGSASEKDLRSSTISSTDTMNGMSTENMNTETSSIHNVMTKKELPTTFTSIVFDIHKADSDNKADSSSKVFSDDDQNSTNFDSIEDVTRNPSNQDIINISNEDKIFPSISTTSVSLPDASDSTGNSSVDVTKPDSYIDTTSINSGNSFDSTKYDENKLIVVSEHTTIENRNDSKMTINVHDQSNTEEKIVEYDMVKNHIPDDNSYEKDDYDFEDKSLEDIQNELMKLLDEMTRKYHNGSTVLM